MATIIMQCSAFHADARQAKQTMPAALPRQPWLFRHPPLPLLPCCSTNAAPAHRGAHIHEPLKPCPPSQAKRTSQFPVFRPSQYQNLIFLLPCTGEETPTVPCACHKHPVEARCQRLPAPMTHTQPQVQGARGEGATHHPTKPQSTKACCLQRAQS